MSASAEQQLLDLTQRLLDCIAAADWATYTELCDESLTAFEPEGRGQLIRGLAFHRYYFDLGAAQGPRHTTLSAPQVWLLGDVGVVAYVRLVQTVGENGPVTSAYEETRVWRKQGGRWRHIHFHRSRPA
jgi:calcium/calmodulin-dependent protein kinase (CaM kinase) II